MLHGSDPDGTVAGFLRELGVERRWVLITRLDSARPVPGSPTLRRALGEDVEWMPAGVVAPGRVVERAIDAQSLFNGFDEVVLFESRPGPLEPPPTAFTSDVSLGDRRRGALLAYLDAAGAVAAAGDGVGLTWFRCEIRLEVLPPSDPRAASALWAFMADVVSSYQGRPATDDEVREGLRAFPSDDLQPPGGLFVVALRGEEVVGCGGLRFAGPGLGEVTRVHVVPPERRRGLARRLMAEIERRAREHGLRELRLDTRADLVEARALYERIGYREIPRFSDANPYAGHWFAKRLD